MTATQSSTYQNDAQQFGAGNCIDGVQGSDNGPDGQWVLCHTDPEDVPWIALDFGSPVTVHRVELFKSALGADRIQNVDVRISENLPTSGTNMFSGGTLLGQYAGPDTEKQHIISGQ